MPTIRELLEQALAFRLSGKLDLAEQFYQSVLAADPSNAIANNDYANILRDVGKLDAAIACYRRALESLPDSAMVLGNLGKAQFERGDLSEAEEACRKSIAADPGYLPAYDTLGSVLIARGRFDEAEVVYRRAIELEPDFVEALFNLALVLGELGRPLEAEETNRRALEVNPNLPEARAQQGALRLLAGDFERGWPDYEWRWQTRQLLRNRLHFPQPVWDGQPLPGKTILLYAEQGYGDVLQFVRYAALVKQRCASVLIGCQPALGRLLESCPGVAAVIRDGEPLPSFDAQAALSSLPFIFRTTLETIPAEVPYLCADKALAESWRKEFDTQNFNIGIAWQGNPAQQRDRLRSFSPEHFAPLAKLPGVRLYSLQKGAGRERLADELQRWPATDLADRLRDFADTAAVMANLDLVITCDSSPAHLAGALGVPVWVALAFVADWRWLLNRDDSPWYPTMRLFRQRERDNWAEVFERIRQALSEKK